MAQKNSKKAPIGKIKKSTDSIIDQAIARQNDWMENRRGFAKGFLSKINVFAKPKSAVEKNPRVMALKSSALVAKKTNTIASYWFPILCAVLVILILIWVAFFRTYSNSKTLVVMPGVPEPIIRVVAETDAPSFDIVRIEKDGSVVIAGRWLPYQTVSILVNKKIIATERTDERGEFAYTPKRNFKPGNYTISLIGVEKNIKSENQVFIYISEHGFENSVSLLITKDGSTLLQSPKLVDGDLHVSKIDYLETGRIVITGNALPRLRVSLSLDDKYIGFARVSDYKHFGLGADIPKLKSGTEYTLAIRLHDGDGKTVANVSHKFVMPESTGDGDTFYTVRRGDCLWVIAKNFMRRGILFSIIAERNNIKNPNLIYPKQILDIPIDGK